MVDAVPLLDHQPLLGIFFVQSGASLRRQPELEVFRKRKKRKKKKEREERKRSGHGGSILYYLSLPYSAYNDS